MEAQLTLMDVNTYPLFKARLTEYFTGRGLAQADVEAVVYAITYCAADGIGDGDPIPRYRAMWPELFCPLCQQLHRTTKHDRRFIEWDTSR